MTPAPSSLDRPRPHPLRGLLCALLGFGGAAAVPVVVSNVLPPASVPKLLAVGNAARWGSYVIVWMFLVAPLVAAAAGVVGKLGLEEAKRGWLAFEHRPQGEFAWVLAFVGLVLTVGGLLFASSLMSSTGVLVKATALPAAAGVLMTILGVGGALTDLLGLSATDDAGAPAAMEAPRSAPARTPSVVDFACPSCSRENRVPAAYAGKKGRCPRCKGVVRVPGARPRRTARAAP